MIIYPTPSSGYHTKTSAGLSDCSIGSNGVMKFMGCSILGFSQTLGWNGSASSMSIHLAEDLAAADTFVNPTIPSIYGFSTPSGGEGRPIFFPTGTNLNQIDF